MRKVFDDGDGQRETMKPTTNAPDQKNILPK